MTSCLLQFVYAPARKMRDCLWCSDNAYKPRSARTVSMTLKKHADEFGLEHDNHIQNALGKRVNGFWGIEALVAPPVL